MEERNKRKDVNFSTFKKIEKFLNEQKNPVFKSTIANNLKIDYDSLNLVLDILKVKTTKEGKVYKDSVILPY